MLHTAAYKTREACVQVSGYATISTESLVLWQKVPGLAEVDGAFTGFFLDILCNASKLLRCHCGPVSEQ